jgi:acyl carrier protein
MNDKLRKIISEVLAVAEDDIDSSTSTETQPKWDSLRHMNLILAIEDDFGVRFTDDEIPFLTSVSAIERSLAARE